MDKASALLASVTDQLGTAVVDAKDGTVLKARLVSIHAERASRARAHACISLSSRAQCTGELEGDEGARAASTCYQIILDAGAVLASEPLRRITVSFGSFQYVMTLSGGASLASATRRAGSALTEHARALACAPSSYAEWVLIVKKNPDPLPTA